MQQLMAQTVATYGRLNYAFSNAGIEIEEASWPTAVLMSSMRSWG